MYAVIKSGGKQYRVTEGQTVKLEKLTAEPGDKIAFEQVLMVSDDGHAQIGEPYLEGAKVTAEVLNQDRAKKIKIIKFRRRKHSDKQMGHRQYFTEVKITKIEHQIL